MQIGIDGNMWFVSNGLCLADPRSHFVFRRVLRDALCEYQDSVSHLVSAGIYEPYLDMTAEEYQAKATEEA